MGWRKVRESPIFYRSNGLAGTGDGCASKGLAGILGSKCAGVESGAGDAWSKGLEAPGTGSIDDAGAISKGLTEGVVGEALGET